MLCEGSVEMNFIMKANEVVSIVLYKNTIYVPGILMFKLLLFHTFNFCYLQLEELGGWSA